MLAYKKDFGLHQLNVLGLAEAQKMITRGFYTTATNFSTDRFGYDNLQAGAVRLWEGTGSYYEAPHLASFLGRVNYIYDGKYIATVNARADASSKVGANNKWGFFPSASVAWVLTEEEFMEGVSWVRNLKIRSGYGLSGNQDAIDSYNSLRLMKPNGVVSVNGDDRPLSHRLQPPCHRRRSRQQSTPVRPGCMQQEPAHRYLGYDP